MMANYPGGPMRPLVCRLGIWAAISAAVIATSPARAAAPRDLPAGQLPADHRLQPLKDLDGYFPFHPPANRDAWPARKESLTRRMQVAMGLWPLPAKTPLKAVVHGRLDQGDYTVEKVYFESLPGFFVTGNLYRPAKLKTDRVPGVLCPHGHWSDGRFYDCGLAAVRREIVQGAERFENGGRSPLQSRCVQLARMGCIVFHYDMLGYADSVQISYELAHRFAKQRPEMNHPERWGLYSPQAESNLQSVMGLQTWNSIRALDFLESLPEIDPQRLAVTGASGGGTQTFVVSTIDPRVNVSVPAVMVSTAMQGGCTCENACLLRIAAGNVDYAACFAPKPQAMTAANDWTKEMQTKGFPELKRLYELFEAPDRVQLFPFIWFEHNYNYVSRAAMYGWFNQHLKLGLASPIVEEDYPRLDAQQLTVWDAEHPQPIGGEDFERDLLQAWKADSDRQLQGMRPSNDQVGEAFRKTVGGAVDVLVGRRLPDADSLEFVAAGGEAHDGYRAIAGRLRYKPASEELPVVLLVPGESRSQTAVWLARDGKSAMFGDDGQPLPAVRRLLAAGVTVLGADLLYQGEFLADGQPLDKTSRVANPRESAAYTFGYNPSVFAERVRDVLTLIAFARSRGAQPASVSLVGLDGSGPWAAVALAQAGEVVERAAIDTGGFRFGKVSDLHSPDFLPGGAKYFDLPGMLALAAPCPLWLAGEAAEADGLVAEAYRAAGQQEALHLQPASDRPDVEAAIGWLIGR